MNKIREQFRIVCQSKNPREFFCNIPWGFVDFIAFVPVFMFMFLPIYQFINNFLFPSFYYSGFMDAVKSINKTALIMGIVFLLFFIGKTICSENKPDFKNIVKENIPALLFVPVLLMMIASTIANGITEYTINGEPYRNESLLTFFLYFCFYYFCTSKIRSQKLKSILLYTVIISGAVLAIFELINYYITPVPAYEYSITSATIYYNINHYAYFLTIITLLSSVMFIKEKNIPLKIINIITFITNSVVLIINNTFGCYLACLVALIFSCIVLSIAEKKLNKMALLMLTVFVCISLVMSIWFNTVFTNMISLFVDISKIVQNADGVEYAGTSRWGLWTLTIEYIMQKPILGFGIEGIGEQLYSSEFLNDRPHNEFLQYAVFFGIPAALFYISGVFSIYLKALKNKSRLDTIEKASLIAGFAYLFSSLFGNTMFYTAPYLFILLGLGTVRSSDLEGK